MSDTPRQRAISPNAIAMMRRAGEHDGLRRHAGEQQLRERRHQRERRGGEHHEREPERVAARLRSP